MMSWFEGGCSSFGEVVMWITEFFLQQIDINLMMLHYGKPEDL